MLGPELHRRRQRALYARGRRGAGPGRSCKANTVCDKAPTKLRKTSYGNSRRFRTAKLKLYRQRRRRERLHLRAGTLAAPVLAAGGERCGQPRIGQPRASAALPLSATSVITGYSAAVGAVAGGIVQSNAASIAMRAARLHPDPVHVHAAESHCRVPPIVATVVLGTLHAKHDTRGLDGALRGWWGHARATRFQMAVEPVARVSRVPARVGGDVQRRQRDPRRASRQRPFP